MSFQYKIYGLHITSNRRIKLLSEQKNDETDLEVFWTTEAGETPDAKIEWKPVLTRELKQKKGIFLWNGAAAAGIYTKLRYNTEISRIDFLLDASKKRLWILHDEDERAGDLDSYFVGPVLGCMLRLRGVVCLHASAVNINGKAVIFLGKKRSGKSTTAAAFSKLGYKILADDVAALTPNGKGFYVQPGYPKIRLRPQSAAALLDKTEADSLETVYKHRPSRYLSLEKNKEFSDEPLPLGAIYLLGAIDSGDTTPFIEAVNPQKKLINLTENTFGSYVVTKDLRIGEFLFLSELAKKIPIRQLMYGHNLDTLPLQCRTIIEDLRKMT